MASDLTDAPTREDQQVADLQRALRGSERRFDAIVGSLSDAVTIRDREHRFLYANRAALAHLGFDSWEQLRETPPSLIMSDYLVWGEDGREITMQDIPSVRILNGEQAEPLLIRTVNAQHRRAAVESPEGGAAARRGRRGGGDDHDHRGGHRAAALRASATRSSPTLPQSSRARSTTSRRCATSPISRCRRSPTGARWTCSTRTAIARRSRSRTSIPSASASPWSCVATSPSDLDPEQGLGKALLDGQAGAVSRYRRGDARRGAPLTRTTSSCCGRSACAPS